MTGVHKLVDQFLDKNFNNTTLLPSHTYDRPKSYKFRTSVLNMQYLYQKDFDYKEDIQQPGHLSKKTKATRFLRDILINDDELLQTILTRYVYLLEEQNEGYVIDMTSLNELKLRPRYHSLACKITISKDLKTIAVSQVKSANLAMVNTIAILALTLFSLLRAIVSGVYEACTSTLPFAARLQDIGNTIVHGVDDAGPITQDIIAISSTQKTIYPFQHGTPQFLERVDRLLLSHRGLLYHISGADHDSMIEYVSKLYNHHLPKKSVLDELVPLKSLGTEYWNNIKIFIEDCLQDGNPEKKHKPINPDKLKKFVNSFPLPKSWAPVDTITYILWQQTFHHSLIIHAAIENMERVGLYWTLNDELAHEGTEKVIQAFEDFYKPYSTSLIASNEVVYSPALSRKFISTKQLIQKNEKQWKQFDFLSPEKISIALV